MKRYDRRTLFDPFRRKEEKSTGFSLDDFYAKRADRGDTGGIPEIELREGLARHETTAVGTPRAPTSTDLPAIATTRIAGVVRIRKHACLAWQRSFCTICSERCPERAIVVEEGRPTVVEDRCTGCGICVGICPAPINGFDIVPNE